MRFLLNWGARIGVAAKNFQFSLHEIQATRRRLLDEHGGGPFNSLFMRFRTNTFGTERPPPKASTFNSLFMRFRAYASPTTTLKQDSFNSLFMRFQADVAALLLEREDSFQFSLHEIHGLVPRPLGGDRRAFQFSLHEIHEYLGETPFVTDLPKLSILSS